MLNTIEECNEELERIDLEIAQLKLERKYVSDVMHLLTPKISTDGLSSKIFEIIKENPGISGKGIKTMLDSKHTTRQITNSISNLRLFHKKVENRGGRGMAARYYVKKEN